MLLSSLWIAPLLVGAGPLDDYPATVQAALAAWQVPGAAVTIVRGDEVLLSRGIGVRDVTQKQPVDPNTVFAIASLTKGFTGVLLARAVISGAIAWDEPLARYLPTFQVLDPELSRTLSVRDLTSHRTGLSEVSDALWYQSGRTRAEILEALRQLPATMPPRTGYNYLNVTYLVLGELLERIGRVPWSVQVQKQLLQPADMRSTFVDARSCRGARNRATPHRDDEGRATPVEWEDADNIAPAAALCSTATDLGKWMQYLMGPQVEARLRQEIFSPGNLIPVTDYARKVYPGLHLQAYGAGWVLQHHQGRFVAWNTGGLDGVTATIVLVPDERIGIAVLTNGPRTSLPEALAFQALDLLTGAPPRDWSGERLALSLAGRERQAQAIQARAAARVKDTHPALPLAAYQGSYEQPLLGRIELRLEGPSLVAALRGWVGEVRHYHYDTFEIVWRQSTLGTTRATFSLDPSGAPTTLELEDYGRFTRRVSSR